MLYIRLSSALLYALSTKCVSDPHDGDNLPTSCEKSLSHLKLTDAYSPCASPVRLQRNLTYYQIHVLATAVGCS